MLITLFLVVFAVLLALTVVLFFFLDGWYRLISVFAVLVIFVAAYFWAQKNLVTPAVTEPRSISLPFEEPVACEPVACEPVVIIPDEPVEPEYDVYINGCPVGSLGTNPNNDEPLIFKQDPYPGVLCEFEVYYATQIAKISFPDGQTPLVQDWAVSCPTGPLCEGTWVQIDTVYVPAGVLVHYWVYPNSYTVQVRFPSFACEYLAYGNKGHTNANIRTAPWALESGSTFDVPACVGFTGEPGK